MVDCPALFQHIPELVHLTICYFYARESFLASEHSDGIKLSEDNMVMSKEKTGFATAFLGEVVSHGRHCWRFKMLAHPIARSFTVAFGICDAEIGISKVRDSDIRSMKGSYFFTVLDSSRHADGMSNYMPFVAAEKYALCRGYDKDRLQTGDIIDVKLDMDE